jgi:hypothetical protein
VEHPNVVEGDFPATQRRAVFGTHRLATNNESALRAEAAVAVVLMPDVVSSGKTIRSTTRTEDQVTQANDL